MDYIRFITALIFDLGLLLDLLTTKTTHKVLAIVLTIPQEPSASNIKSPLDIIDSWIAMPSSVVIDAISHLEFEYKFPKVVYLLI